MICFLTSKHNIPDSPKLNPANGFAAALRDAVPQNCRTLIVCSAPDDYDKTDLYSGSMLDSFRLEGYRFSQVDVLDRRNQDKAEELVKNADFIVLMGGHVPTQNTFFQEIRLRELMKEFDGVVLGVSAGSMNSAEVVYAQPELPGEAVDPAYQRFLPGLGLTKAMILPHYQEIKDDLLDGMRVFEEIAFPDSFGRRFYVFPDGTYLYLHDGVEEIRGEAWVIEDGAMRKIGEDGDVTVL